MNPSRRKHRTPNVNLPKLHYIYADDDPGNRPMPWAGSAAWMAWECLSINLYADENGQVLLPDIIEPGTQYWVGVSVRNSGAIKSFHTAIELYWGRTSTGFTSGAIHFIGSAATQVAIGEDKFVVVGPAEFEKTGDKHPCLMGRVYDPILDPLTSWTAFNPLYDRHIGVRNLSWLETSTEAEGEVIEGVFEAASPMDGEAALILQAMPMPSSALSRFIKDKREVRRIAIFEGKVEFRIDDTKKYTRRKWEPYLRLKLKDGERIPIRYRLHMPKGQVRNITGVRLGTFLNGIPVGGISLAFKPHRRTVRLSPSKIATRRKRE